MLQFVLGFFVVVFLTMESVTNLWVFVGLNQLRGHLLTWHSSFMDLVCFYLLVVGLSDPVSKGKTFQKRTINCVLVFLYKLFILSHLLHSRQRQPCMESNYRWTGDPHRVVRIWRPDCDLLEIRGVPESDSPNTVTAVKGGF